LLAFAMQDMSYFDVMNPGNEGEIIREADG